MERELNDAVVGILNTILNICHAIALLVLIVGNIVLALRLPADTSGFMIVVAHLGGSLLFIFSYCLMSGVVSVFLSINRNLQRLVALQEVPQNSNVRTVASAEGAAAIKKLQQWSPAKERRTPEQIKRYERFRAQMDAWEKSRATPPDDA